MKTFKDFIAEGTLPRGTQVTVVHRHKTKKEAQAHFDSLPK